MTNPDIEKALEEYLEDVEPLMDAAYRYYVQRQMFSNSRLEVIEDEKISHFNKLIEKLAKQLDGTPEIIIIHRDDEKPVFDTYVDSLLGELVHSVNKSLKTIKEVKIYLVLLGFSRYYEEKDVSEHFTRLYSEMFWDSLEMSYIRLASTWDRVGGLLEFVFFNIRQYDRDGFNSTISKINLNIAKMDDDLGKSTDWKELWNYSKSENQDGLKWLLSRRNLIIHQVGLQEISNYDFNDENDYDSYYNHILDRAIKGKLKPLSRQEESKQLSHHINMFFNLFNNTFNICESYLEKIPRIK